jgi:hypothetical protein
MSTTANLLYCVLFTLLSLGCSGNGGGDGKQGGNVDGSVPQQCLSGTPCAIDPDCTMGERCNRQLSPPQCQRLYCGAQGTLCDGRNELCNTGLVCNSGQCSAGAASCFPGRSCTLDTDCEMDQHCNMTLKQCQRLHCGFTGSACDNDNVCADEFVCVTGKCAFNGFCFSPCQMDCHTQHPDGVKCEGVFYACMCGACPVDCAHDLYCQPQQSMCSSHPCLNCAMSSAMTCYNQTSKACAQNADWQAFEACLSKCPLQ